MKKFEIGSIKITPVDFNEMQSSFENIQYDINFYPIWEYKWDTTHEDTMSANVFVPGFLLSDLPMIKSHVINELKDEMMSRYALFHLRNDLWKFKYDSVYTKVHSIDIQEWYIWYGKSDGIAIKATVKVSFSSAQR